MGNGVELTGVKRIDDALAQVLREEEQLERLRADHLAVTSSRSYALHSALEKLASVFASRPHAVRRETADDAIVDRTVPFDSQAFDRLCAAWRDRAATRPLSTVPVVTIVIPAYNQSGVTMRCLQSIADTWFDTLGVQIVLVDDASSDETTRFAELPGLEVVRNERNLGFIGACNRGAENAPGRYLCFLNNDTEVRNAWLDELVATAENDGSIGVVGAKLVYPSGALQEAGGIIYRSGSGANYGRGGDPSDSRYNYVREVDYCSGAALLVRRELFCSVGGFSTEYAPAYYEDTDLCFAARAAGYRVVYQPRSEVLHYEGLSNGTDTSSGLKRYQTINHAKFAAKWSADLAWHLEDTPFSQALAARRIRRGETILVIDSYVPLHDRESGSKRLFELLKIMRSGGFHVIFLPDNYAPIAPYTSELEAMGVEVLYHIPGGRSADEAIDEILPILDFAWICRPELFHKYHGSISRNSATRIIYDTVDLHFVREQRAYETLALDSAKHWKTTRERELDAARKAALTVTVTDTERTMLEDLGIENVRVIPNLHSPGKRSAYTYDMREGLLFIGSYNHAPNVDAALWLSNEVMPLVRERLADVSLTLLGSNPPSDVLALAGKSVHVPGYVADVEPYFERHRVFVAPLRFGAGLKGKVGQSLSHGLPIVMTPIAAEGFDLEHERDYLSASSAREFCDAIVRLYSDRELWQRISDASAHAIRPFSPAAVAPNLHALFRDLRFTQTP